MCINIRIFVFHSVVSSIFLFVSRETLSLNVSLIPFSSKHGFSGVIHLMLNNKLHRPSGGGHRPGGAAFTFNNFM